MKKRVASFFDVTVFKTRFLNQEYASSADYFPELNSLVQGKFSKLFMKQFLITKRNFSGKIRSKHHLMLEKQTNKPRMTNKQKVCVFFITLFQNGKFLQERSRFDCVCVCFGFAKFLNIYFALFCCFPTVVLRA